jgi:hypothetical protein
MIFSMDVLLWSFELLRARSGTARAPEDVLGLRAAAEQHILGRAEIEVVGDLEDPDVIGRARDGDLGRDGDRGASGVETGRQRQSAELATGQVEMVGWRPATDAEVE